jgi:Uma2 family endonuclease
MSAVLTPTPAAGLLTAAEFAALPPSAYGSKQELFRGKVVTLSPPAPQPAFVRGVVQLALASELRAFVMQAGTGRVTLESGPDVAYWSFDRLPADQAPAAYPDVAADLVAEVISPGNTRRRVAEKIREYFARSVRLVWVVDPDERSVTVYTRPGDGTVLWIDATLTGGDVLPNFACAIATLFESLPA